MRSFDLTGQIAKLTASGIGRVQRISDDVYRRLWPKTVELPARHEGRFDRALLVDVFPMYPMSFPVDEGGRRVSLPVRLAPLPGGKPAQIAFEPGDDVVPEGPLRYILFWQAGGRWKARSPNAMRSRFDADERGLRLNEGLHLPLQEPELARSRRIPLSERMDERGTTHFLRWDGSLPSITTGFGMYAELEGVPSCAKDVIVVSTEDRDLFLKD